MAQNPIYSAIEVMLPYFKDKFGNAGSRTHPFGREAEEAVDEAREAIAGLINAKHHEIIFTSGATEAVNLALHGVFEANKERGDHIITVSTEHKAVLDTCKFLEDKGCSVTYLPVNNEGLIDLKKLEDTINDKTILIAIMYANNETGVIQKISELSAIVHNYGILFMTDGTQAVGKIPVDVQNDGIDLMAFSAHKLCGPKGIGALYIKKKEPKIQLSPLIYGGGNEKGLRSGTLNVPAIVGFGKACKIAKEKLGIEIQNIALLRDQLETHLLEIDNTVMNGSAENRLPNTSNISFGGVEANMLIEAIQNEIAVATGSACTSALQEPSHVLKAMGLSPEHIHSSVRFSLGRFTNTKEIDYTVSKIKNTIAFLQKN